MTDHNHHGEYAELRHGHDNLDRDNQAAQRESQALREAFRELRSDLEEIFNRLSALEWLVAQLRDTTGGGQ